MIRFNNGYAVYSKVFQAFLCARHLFNGKIKLYHKILFSFCGFSLFIPLVMRCRSHNAHADTNIESIFKLSNDITPTHDSSFIRHLDYGWFPHFSFPFSLFFAPSFRFQSIQRQRRWRRPRRLALLWLIKKWNAQTFNENDIQNEIILFL